MKQILIFIFTLYQVTSCLLLVYGLSIFAADIFAFHIIFRKDIQFDMHRVTFALVILVIPNASYGFWKGMRRIKEEF